MRPTTPSTGNRVQPAPVPGQQSEDGGQKNNGEQGSHPAQNGRAAGPRAHPGPAHAAQPKGQQKSCQAERLQQQVAQVGAEEADPVVAARRRVGGRVQRGIGGVIGGQGEEKKKRDQHQHHPQKDVHGAAARRRENNADGLHDEGRFDSPAAVKIFSGRPEERAKRPRAVSIIGVGEQAIPGEMPGGGTNRITSAIRRQKTCDYPADDILLPRSAARRRAGCGRWRTW